MAIRHKSRVRPLKRRYWASVLAVDALGGIGWAFECDCGAKGKRRDTYADARADLFRHRYEEHP